MFKRLPFSCSLHGVLYSLDTVGVRLISRFLLVYRLVKQTIS